MASNEIKIGVEFKDTIKKVPGLAQQISARGGFDSASGEKAKNALTNLYSVVKSLADKTSLTGSEFDTLRSGLRDITKILTDFSVALPDVTEGLKKASDELQNLLKERKNLYSQKEAVNDSLLKRQEALSKATSGHAIYKINKSGGLSKQSLTLGTTLKNLEKGDIPMGYMDDNGQIVPLSSNKAAMAAAAGYQGLLDHKGALNVSIGSQNQAINAKKAQIEAMGRAPKNEVDKLYSAIVDLTTTIKNELSAQISVNKEQENVDKITDLDKGMKNSSPTKGLFKQFAFYTLAIRGIKTAAREAKETIQELDKYLTEQAMVTGKTREETYALVGAYQELAIQTGATTKEVAGVATEYMKQGKSTKDALVLTEAAVSAAKVARVSVGDSVNYLTTALNGFRLSADQAMAVSDKFAALAASSATDYDELAIALSKVASQANLAGMSIDYTTALLTKGLETTREAPETMGTALKTIIARMREMSDYGKTLEGDTDINNVESQLKVVGIALRNQQGELRSTQDVLDELGKKWDTLNKNQQAALAKALAGTRQQSRLIAMMDGYERVTELQQIAERSAGATAAQAGVYLEGMEAAINKIKAAWEQVIMAVTDSDIVIDTFQLIGSLLDGLGKALQLLPDAVSMFTILGITAGVIAYHKAKELALDTADLIIEKGKTAENAKQLISEKRKLRIAVLRQAMNWKALAIAAGIATLIGVAYGIWKAIEWNSAEGAAKDVNKLSNEIYKLNEKSNGLNETIKKFDDLDSKVIKTAKDMEEMNSILDAGVDKLSQEEKEYYDTLTDVNEKRKYLEDRAQAAEVESRKKREEQKKRVDGLSPEERSKLLHDTSSESLKAQSAFRANARQDIYDQIDALGDLGRSTAETERIMSSVISNMDMDDVYNSLGTDRLKALTRDLAELESTNKFLDEDEKLSTRIESFREIQMALSGDAAALEAFNKAYSEWQTFSFMDEDIIKFIDDTNLSIDAINELFVGYKKLQKSGINIGKEEYQTALENTLGNLTKDFSTLNEVLAENFTMVQKGTEEWSKLVDVIGDQFAVSILDMGQKMEKFNNSTNSFYETAAKWSTLSESKKAEFIANNAEFFEGEQGAEMLKAFESQNYEAIESVLGTIYGTEDENGISKQQQMLEEVQRTLAIERAKAEKDQNKAYIRQLEEYEKQLEDTENLFKASLEVRLKQEQEQLKEFKNLKKEEQKAEVDSLNKRKKAYEKYFETINKEEEQEEYEEKAALLASNIGKLGADTSGSSGQKRAELTKQLKDLEKERQKELRKQAQEQAVKDIDKAVEQINDKFDKLLESNRELLAVMSGEMKNPTQFIGNMLSNKINSGASALEMNQYVNDLKTKYGSQFGPDAFNDVSFETRNNNLVLNVAGREIVLSQTDQASVAEAVYNALKAVGLQ